MNALTRCKTRPVRLCHSSFNLPRGFARNILSRNTKTRAENADTLAVSAQGFRRGANRVRKQMWWKDMRMRIIIGIGICVLIVIIVVPIVKA